MTSEMGVSDLTSPSVHRSHFAQIHERVEAKKKGIGDWWHRKRGFDRHSNVLPWIVADTCDFLEKRALTLEGIFRVSGQVSNVQSLKKKYDKGKRPNLESLDPYTVAGTLKQFFIEPEESILTDELYEAFMEGISVSDPDERIYCTAQVIDKLPKTNKLIFQRLCRLLKDVSKHSEENKMSSHNLAIVFAPTLLRKDHQSINSILSDSEKATRLVELFIDNYDSLFSTSTLRIAKRSSKGPSSDEMDGFYKTLKRGTFVLDEIKIKELEKIDKSVVAMHYGVVQEEVTESMMNRYYSDLCKNGLELLRNISQDDQVKVKKTLSEQWQDFFGPPPPSEASPPNRLSVTEIFQNTSLSDAPQDDVSPQDGTDDVPEE